MGGGKIDVNERAPTRGSAGSAPTQSWKYSIFTIKSGILPISYQSEMWYLPL